MSVEWEQWNLSYLADVFGPLFGPGSVKQAMVRTLQLWLPSYIHEINRQLGANVLAEPNDYFYQPTERPVVARTAQVMVAVPNTVKTERFRSGTRATFEARATVFFAGTADWNESEFIAQAYCAAVMAAIGQHPSLAPPGETFAETTVWQGMKLGQEKRSSSMYRVLVVNSFHVALSNVMSPFGGPPAPSVLAPEPPVTVSSENVQVTQLT